MKPYRSAKVLATVFLGVLFGTYKHYQQMRWAGLGRSAFLVDQSHQFDAAMSPPHGALVAIVAGIVLAAIVMGLYELLVAGIASVLPPGTVEE